MGVVCCSQVPSSKDDTEFMRGGEVDSNALVPPSKDDAGFERAAAVSDAVDKDSSVPKADAPATAAAASEQAAAAPVSAAVDPAATSGRSSSAAAGAPATSATGPAEHCPADAAPVAVQAEAAPPAASPAPPAEPAKVDFSGHWLLTATDDMTDVMNEKKVGWAMRAAAKAAGYGVGKVEQIIKQTGDNFVIETKAAKNFTQQFVADGKEALVSNNDGELCPTTATWEQGNTVMVTVSRTKDGSSGGSLRRYMDGDKYVMMIVTPKGVKCRRIFSRK